MHTNSTKGKEHLPFTITLVTHEEPEPVEQLGIGTCVWAGKGASYTA